MCSSTQQQHSSTQRALEGKAIDSLFPPESVAFPSRNVCYSCPSVSKRVHVPVFALFYLQKWKDMVGHGRTWRDMVGHGRTWEDMIRNGRQGKTR